MNHAAANPADQALNQWVKGGRTLADIGGEFAYLRRERGLGLDDLAHRAALPLETVQAVESGIRTPTGEEFMRLAQGLGLAPSELAEILRPVVRHQASGIGAFRSCDEPER